jgi:hypothetical protein
MAPKRKAKDMALVYAPADDGDGYKILRQRGRRPLEAGMLRPMKSGRAIADEVVHLEPRKESPLLFDVETDEELSSPEALAARASRGGPPQVATEKYRRGWDAIWGTKPRSSALN